MGLPTAADYEKQKLPPDVRAKINKRSAQKGSEYERVVAKKISSYFGIDWRQAFLKTKRTTGGQPHGDLMPIQEMYNTWKAAGLGPIECKNRKEWSFDEVFKRPNTCTLFQYWLKSNKDTGKDNSIIFFTKPGVTDYVMHLSEDGKMTGSLLTFEVDVDQTILYFTIQTLPSFLHKHWPEHFGTML